MPVDGSTQRSRGHARHSCLHRWRTSEIEFRIFQFFCALLFGYDWGLSKHYPCAKWTKRVYRAVMFTWIMGYYVMYWAVDDISFNTAPLDDIVVDSNVSIPHPRLKFDNELWVTHAICTIFLLEPILMGFMFRWCDVAMPFMQEKFIALKKNSHPARFLGLFYGYMMCFSVGIPTFAFLYHVRMSSKNYDGDLAMFKDLQNQKNGSLTRHEAINGCCVFRNAWAYMDFPFPTGSVEAGVASRKLIGPPAMALFYLHNFWASGVWSMLLAMLYVESLTYIEKISWQEINSGTLLADYPSPSPSFTLHSPLPSHQLRQRVDKIHVPS